VEEAVALPTHADMLASWGEPSLPTMLCNEHDVLMFQVEGSREWRLHSPVDNGLISYDREELDRRPEWCGVLNTGDVLYVPRGWMHRDEPTDRASLCVAAKFRQPTGIDLIARVAQQLSNTKLKSDIPRFGSVQKSCEYLTFFQSELTEAAGRAGVLAGALAEIQMTAEPRVRFSLPWSASEVPLPPSEDFHIIPLVRFPSVCIRHRAGEDAFEVFVGPSATKFGDEFLPVVERVLHSQGVAIK
jgi:hypothetical protein